MNQPSVEEILKLFAKSPLGQTMLDFILDHYYLIDKEEPIPGAVSKAALKHYRTLKNRSGFFEVEKMADDFDIYPKGTVARLMGEVEGLKKVIDQITNHSESQQKVKELQAEIDRLRVNQKPHDYDLLVEEYRRSSSEFNRLNSEIDRLKVKCNTYAKRIVNDGADDVAWEITEGQQKPKAVGCGKMFNVKEYTYIPCTFHNLCPDCQAKQKKQVIGKDYLGNEITKSSIKVFKVSEDDILSKPKAVGCGKLFTVRYRNGITEERRCGLYGMNSEGPDLCPDCQAKAKKQVQEEIDFLSNKLRESIENPVVSEVIIPKTVGCGRVGEEANGLRIICGQNGILCDSCEDDIKANSQAKLDSSAVRDSLTPRVELPEVPYFKIPYDQYLAENMERQAKWNMAVKKHLEGK